MDVLRKLYPQSWPDIPMSEMKEASSEKKISFICKALTCINESWSRSYMWIDSDVKTGDMNVEHFVLATLDCIVRAARELFDVPDEVLTQDHVSIYSSLKQGFFARSGENAEVSLSAVNGNANEKRNGTRKTDVLGKIQQPVMPKEGSLSTSMLLKQDIGPLPPPPPPPPLPPTTTGIVPLKISPCPPSPAPQKGAVPSMTPMERAPTPPTPIPPASMTMASKDVVPSTKKPITGTGPPPPPLPPSVHPSDKVAARSPSEKMKPTPPPPPVVPRTLPKKTGPSPPPPLPALGAGRLQLPRKATSKLKRSTQMANLFQELKRKMDESSLAVMSTNKKRIQLGGHTGGKQGMGASIAELTKRSTYFQQIQEDVRVHRKSILALQAAINSFQTNDMVKLLKFQNNVESILEVLSDESQVGRECVPVCRLTQLANTNSHVCIFMKNQIIDILQVQVLAKFEGFPTKKLETLRTATALCSKFDTMINTLKDWEVKPPLGQLLDKTECYLKKIKLELDAFERSKDEQSKKFKSHNIEFDFLTVTRIKEAMIDLSSCCMELAIREIRETKNAGDNQGAMHRTNKEKEGSAKMLWRVFQLAFRAYSFAGGQDDRANMLAKQLADELLEKPTNQ